MQQFYSQIQKKIIIQFVCKNQIQKKTYNIFGLDDHTSIIANTPGFFSYYITYCIWSELGKNYKEYAIT